MQSDLEKFKRLGLQETRNFFFEVLAETHLFPDALSAIQNAVFVAYDIETVTISPEGKVQAGDTEEESDAVEGGETIITCASYSCFTNEGKIKTFVLPFVNFMQRHWHNDRDFGLALQFLRDANATDTPKVMHNGIYDCLHSIVYHAWPRNFCLDTMAMAYSQYSSLPKSLDFLASIVLPDFYQWKPQAQEASQSKDINKYWEYNAKDTFNTARICVHYLKHLPAYARRNYATQFKLVYPALYCGFEGSSLTMLKEKNCAESVS